MKAFKIILMILNIQILATMLWIAFGDYNVLTNLGFNIIDEYLQISMFVIPAMNIIYFIVSLVKKREASSI